MKSSNDSHDNVNVNVNVNPISTSMMISSFKHVNLITHCQNYYMINKFHLNTMNQISAL